MCVYGWGEMDRGFEVIIDVGDQQTVISGGIATIALHRITLLCHAASKPLDDAHLELRASVEVYGKARV